MINHKKKYIFIHIPKTGGSSIEKALLSHEGVDMSSGGKTIFSNLSKDILDEYVLGKSRQHFEMHRFENKFQENYFSFCFVRNPWDWVVSEFEWMRDVYNDFDEYVYKMKNGSVMVYKYHLNPQVSFINKNIKFIGRFENFQDDFSKACKKISIPDLELPHVYKNTRMDYRSYYNNETKKIIENIYLKDVLEFGYKF